MHEQQHNPQTEQSFEDFPCFTLAKNKQNVDQNSFIMFRL